MAYGPFSSGAAGTRLTSTALASPLSYPVTIVCWIRRDADQNADTSNDWIVALGDDLDTDVANTLSLMTDNAADSIRANVYDSAGAQSNDIYPYGDGTYDAVWVPVMAVFRGTGTTSSNCEVYIKDSTGTNGSTSITRNLSGTVLDVIKVGSKIDDSFSAFAGDIAELAIYDADISANFDDFWTAQDTGPRPDTIRTADCIGYWSLDTEQATHVNELSGGATWTLSEVNNPAFVTRTFGTDPISPAHPIMTGGSVNQTIVVPKGPRRR